MEFLKLETALLGQVDDSYYYGIECGSCKRDKRLSLLKLRERLGADYPVRAIRARLKCTTCGSKQLVLMFLAPNQGGTSLQYLFERPLG